MSEQVPYRDRFDRAIGALDGIPDVLKTAPTTLRAVTPLVGSAQTFIVQTFRQKDGGEDGGPARFTVFLEHVDEHGSTRLVIPPVVTAAIARQRDALTDRARSKAAKATAADRKARGIQPGFMKKKK